MTKLQQKIIGLRNEGKSYNKISEELNCSKGTISYLFSKNQKEKNLERTRESRKDNPILHKLYAFLNSKSYISKEKISKNKIRGILTSRITRFCSYKIIRKRIYMEKTFTIDDILKKFSENPKCYLTGEPIDLTKPNSYQLDHIIPSSRGGDNSLQNCGLASKRANMAKTDMTHEEFIEFCRKVVNNYDSNKIILSKNAEPTQLNLNN